METDFGRQAWHGHASFGLLRKAQRLGLGPAGLAQLAIQRGCGYYQGGEPLEPLDVSPAQFSNASWPSPS